MPANKSWARWSKASISKHFQDLLSPAPINEPFDPNDPLSFPLFIEGQHRDTDAIPNFFELRVDGPRLLEVSKDCWKLRVEINILCQSVMNDSDYHIIDDMIGLAQSAFTNSIPVCRFGIRPDDDDSFVGCYVIQQAVETVDYIEGNRLGQIDIQTKLLQSMVEAHYVMDLLV